MKTTTLTVELMHRSSIPGAIWAKPCGWEPENEIEGSEWIDGSWWDDAGNTAGLVCFVEGNEGDIVEVVLSDLRVASCGDCRVINGRVIRNPKGL